MIVSSVELPSGFAFSRTVPWRKKGCCGMVLILDRTCALETFEISTPSMRIAPLFSSSSRRIAETRDDFPLKYKSVSADAT